MKPKGSGLDAAPAIRAVMSKAHRPAVACVHAPAEAFRAGEALSVAFNVEGGASLSAVLHYRHVNHGERWRVAPMELRGAAFHGAIDAEYTNSPYGLQYYFELRRDMVAWLYPAFNSTLSNEPYYTVWKRIV